MIETIAWAVQPSSRNVNRPRKLVEALTNLGLMMETTYVYHGRSSPQPGHIRAPYLHPSSASRHMPNVAVLSPLFLERDMASTVWVDVYDDWSLAPDIHPVNRRIARAGYRTLSKTRKGEFPITVNSEYMAHKIGNGALVVPNGVDEDLWELETSGSSATRLIILGHFFKGRTDFELIDRVVRTRVFDEIVIGGLGTDKTALSLIETLKSDFPGRILVKDWITSQELATYVGSNTVSLIPNLVSDYTLSQDLMKAYTFLGLGLGVICPRLLWPPHLPNDDVYLVGHGDKMEAHLQSWVAQRRSGRDRREAFCQEHSWRRRGQAIAELLK